MCGIAGMLNFDRDRPADPIVLGRMLDSIIHRGPDDAGQWVDRELAMGMRRLSIIDLSGGHQPMHDESGRYHVVFNGEIYNYRELRQELLARGHQLQTQSDTEVIVHLYEEMQAECVHQLRGMFAFAIWDDQDRRLFLARDRLGIKPLYYAQADQCLVFGSEIKSLLQYPSIEPRVDPLAVANYLSVKYVPSPRTMFQGIQSLPPGHTLTCHRGSIRVEQYWDVQFQPQSPELGDSDATIRLRELLEESIRLRLRSDVPFGAFLSGGLDSSLIVALMSRMLSEPVRTFSVGFEGAPEGDELPYARQVATQFGTQHHEILARSSDLVELAERVLWHLDQPIADQATIATYMVSKLASEHVKMVLTGEGGDELFGGYARYAGERLAPWARWIPEFARVAVRHALPNWPIPRRPKIAIHALTLAEEASRHAQWFPLFNSDALGQLLLPEFAEQIGNDGATRVFAEKLAHSRTGDPLHRMLYTDTKLWLPDYLLLRGDKLTMAHSLEARVPLLDHRLVEFAASLPAHQKIRGGQRKWLLRQVAQDVLPRTILDRKKQGFPIPLSHWLRYDARSLVADCLAPDVIRRRAWFRPEAVARLVQRHLSGTADHGLEIWGLISLEMWLQLFVDRARTPCA